MDREVQRREEHDGAGAVVRRYRQLPGVGERRDAPRLADAAAPGEVEHDDAGDAGLEEILEAPAAGEDFRAADRRLRVRRVSFEEGEAVHADRILVPVGVELRSEERRVGKEWRTHGTALSYKK